MNYIKTLLFTAVTVIAVSFSYAQNSFEGRIVYDITYADLDETMAQYESMLAKEMTMIFKGEMSKMIQPTGMGETTVITNNDKQTTTILMDMMGNKMAINKDLAEAKKESEDQKVDIEYIDETMEVAGYNCMKAEMKMEGMDESMIVWYTEDIEAQGGQQFDKLKGFPLKYEMRQKNFTSILTAKTVKKEKISKSEFKIPKEYEEVTEEEFKKMMGGGTK